MKLRPYQQQAVEATLRHFRASTGRACVVLPTGSGKSVVIAELARLARGRVVVLCHVKELCRQNFEKFSALQGEQAGESAGIYSAGLGRKQASQRVTFAGVQSVANNLDDFSHAVSLVIVDECHRVSGEEGSHYERALSSFGQRNADLKVLGLTATPYRLGSGWIYQRHARGFCRSETERAFECCVYELSLRQMIREGFLTRPQLTDAPIAQYDFSALGGTAADSQEDAVNGLLVSHPRVTQAIVEQIVSLTESQGRRGVMIFAASVAHAQEVLGYLPAGQAALVVGESSGQERDRAVAEFCARRIKYLVNVAVLTTGFDAPHVDFIALLRPTASVSLFQQIVGRGLRLAPGKTDCLVVDYAGNGFDLYSPEIGESKPTSDSVVVEVDCPSCGFKNEFWGQVDDEGRVLEHFGRRCAAWIVAGDRPGSRCPYRFRFKECPQCCAENDIAARNCGECQTTLVDPDEQLKQALRLKDALVLRVSEVSLSLEKKRVKLTYFDEDGTSVSERFDFSHPGQLAVFNRVFARRIASGRAPLELTEPEQAVQLQAVFPRPDFVVARRQKLKKARGAAFYRVVERVFDYRGRFRKAGEL